MENYRRNLLFYGYFQSLQPVIDKRIISLWSLYIISLQCFMVLAPEGTLHKQNFDLSLICMSYRNNNQLRSVEGPRVNAINNLQV